MKPPAPRVPRPATLIVSSLCLSLVATALAMGGGGITARVALSNDGPPAVAPAPGTGTGRIQAAPGWPLETPGEVPSAARTAASPALGPRVKAPAAILVDEATGAVLFQRNAGVERPIASIAKVMTGMLVLRHTRPSDLVRVSKLAASQEAVTMGLEPGQRMTVAELMYGLLLWSGNDAAVALAQHVGGSVHGFVGMMNLEAARLGMDRTRFTSPNGLSDRGYSTARDVATMVRWALADRWFARLVATRRHDISGPGGRRQHLRNLNALLWTYRGAIGVKTGYTSAAGNCVAAAARRGSRELVAVVLGDSPSTVWRDAYSDARALLDYGFTVLGTRPSGA